MDETDDGDLILMDELFAGEDDDGAQVPLAPWRVLVVDDDADVRVITRYVTRDFTFDGRPLELIEADSAETARQVIAATPDIAVALLDVVMETDDAGLRLASWIRQEFGDSMMRIILRTGQPGFAPELEVLVAYDINDYKSKAEITDTRLLSTLITGLRGYRDLRAIERGRAGLKSVIQSTRPLLAARSVNELHQAVQNALSALLPVGKVRMIGEGDAGELPGVAEAFSSQKSQLQATPPVLFIPATEVSSTALLLEDGGPIPGELHDVMDTLCDKLAVCFDNFHLNMQIASVHEATVLALADLAEYKDTDTGNHILRVRRYVEAIVASLEEFHRKHPHEVVLPDGLRHYLGAASVLHDVGKVGIADHILRKPGKLEPSEWEVMQTHSSLGFELLARAAASVSRPSYLSVAAEVARHHHERWDGGGYPDALAGEEIPLSARIVAVADVFDALTSVRPYKKAWSVDEALDYIRAQAGSQFDATVVKAFEAALPAILEVHETLKGD